MKVTKEKVENSQAFLTIEMEPAEVEESLEEAYHHLVKRANIPGFRKGKAPRAILERYLGRESLLDDALRHMLPEAYEKALGEQNIQAVAEPQIEVVQKEPLIFKATVPLEPAVRLGDYRGLRLSPEPVEVTEDEVNAVIEQLRHQYATWEPVERPVEYNDLATLDIESSVEGKPFINQKGAQYQVLQELRFPAPGFAAQLVGMKREEEKEFKLVFPADYPRAQMAGKESSFKVRITEVKQEKLPELNEEFVQQIDPELKTLELLRERVREQLRARTEERVRLDFEDKVIEAVTGLSQVEFPPVMVEAEIDRMLDQQLRRLERGGIKLEEYLKSIKKTGPELREELRPQATKRVTSALVLDKIAGEEKVEVSEAEVEAEIEDMVKASGSKQGEMRETLSNPRARETIKQLLVRRKTAQRLAEIAKEPENKQEKEKEGEA